MIEYYRHGRGLDVMEGTKGSLSERARDYGYTPTVLNIDNEPFVVIKKTYYYYGWDFDKKRRVLDETQSLGMIKILLDDVDQILADLETLLNKYHSWVEICNNSPEVILRKEMPLESTLKKYLNAEFYFVHYREEDIWVPIVNLRFLENYYFWEYPAEFEKYEISICDLIELLTLIHDEFCGENSLWSKLV